MCDILLLVGRINSMFKDEITVYWSYWGKYQIRAEEPVPMISDYFKNKDLYEYDYMRCPSFMENFTNTFGVKSIFDYKIKFADKVTSDMYDQNFADEFLNVRNVQSKLASFGLHYIFLAENNDLEMEYLPSMMENNSFNNSAILVPGKINIGKYVRFLDCSFHARENTVEIKENDIFAYARFNTNKKIKLQRFNCTEEMENLVERQNITQYRSRYYKPLEWYYKKQQTVKLKEQVMKLVKKNLV